ncbi:MAG: hypothetical protein K8R41_05010, partial [Bacteroidales bacterium]|nr:hypothetical protein [Bacteroidales bacterium]
MKRNLLLIAIISMFLISCGNQQEQTEQTTDKTEITTIDPIVITVGEFAEKAEELIGKIVVLEGIVDHVCAHGGDKMFIIDENTDGRVKITIGEDMVSFKTEWEGNSIKLKGVIEELKIDEDYLNNWENELLTNDEESEKGKGLGKHKKEDGDHEKGDGDHKTIKGKKADQGEHIDGFEQIKNIR